MDLNRIPPFLLLALGLGCETVSSCLSFDPTEESGNPTTSASTTSASSGSSGSSSTSGTAEVGPCLGAVDETTFTGDSTGSDSGSSSGSGSDSSSGSDTGSTGTTGMMADEPDARAAAMERVLERGTLPPDVAARLRRRLDD